MKLSKKRAIELAVWEQQTRTGLDSPEQDFEDVWTWEDEVKQTKDYEAWINDAPSMIATLAYDGYIGRNSDIKVLKKFLGDKLYQAALEAYFTGDHDT